MDSMSSNAQFNHRKRILAVASGGGHWVQLRRLAPAFYGCDVTYVTVDHCYQSQVGNAGFHVVMDATRWTKFKLIVMFFQIAFIILRVRPDVVISTGAAPGYFALRLGKIFRAKTIWIDSIANIETMSMSGQMVGPHASLWLTQWKHLAKDCGPEYKGSVL
jgi:UDP-N-acetylglucosamine:LPS N-acetylglucosamine transferase